MMQDKIELYGWEVSPYMTKVEIYLKYKGIPFRTVRPNVYTLFRKIQPAVGKAIMPVVYINGKNPIQDSTVIIDYFERQYPDNPLIPESPKQRIAAQLIELYANKWLVMAALHYRWNYPENHNFIIGEFGSNTLPYFPAFIQRKAGKFIAGKMSGYLPLLGITENMQMALEDHTETLLSLLNRHLSKHVFLLGLQPCLADFSLYGFLYAHLHRDPAPQNLVAKHPHVLKWIERLRGKISQDRIVLPDDDSIPASLLPVLVHISQSHMPLIKQSVEAVRLWSRDKSIGDIIPQRIGDTTLTIGKNQETRYNLIEPYWLFQRLCETYQMLENMDKHGVDEFISSVAGLSLIKEPLPINTELKKCRLYVAA
jgi:glutathione S-transferase